MNLYRTLSLFVILAFLAAGCSTAASPTPTPAATATAPRSDAGAQAVDRPTWHTITFTNARTGEQVSLADFAGKTVVVEAMAVWCTNCLRQQQHAAEALKTLGEDVVYISLGIDPSEDAQKLANFAERQGFTWLFGVSNRELTTALIAQFGRAVSNPPSTPLFVIAPDGKTSSLFTGGHDAQALVKLIQENS